MIKNFKHFYRKTLIRMMLKEIEERLLEKTSWAVTVSSTFSGLVGVQISVESWQSIKLATITNCFGIHDFT